MLPREWRRFLATLGRRFTVQGLERRGEHPYPILLALRDGLRSGTTSWSRPRSSAVAPCRPPTGSASLCAASPRPPGTWSSTAAGSYRPTPRVRPVADLRDQADPTTREGHYTLDELLGNETDLPIREHATDTHGATLVNFGLFDLVGKSLTPRVRDLGKITMVRGDSPAATNALYPHAGPLPADR